jgi:hypothetical protein
MSTRAKAGVGSIAIFLCVFFWSCYYYCTKQDYPGPINHTNCQKIIPGMTGEQVETILGGEPIAKGVKMDLEAIDRGDPPESPFYVWTGEWGEIRVWFDKNDLVERAVFIPKTQTTFIEKLTQWFPW